MLDIKAIRENPEKFKSGLKSKNENEKIDELLQLDLTRRKLIQEAEELKALKNKVSSEIAVLKKNNEDATIQLTEMKKVAEDTKTIDERIKEVDEKIYDMLIRMPNIPHESVPLGKSANENVEVRNWIPADFSFEFKFEVKDHLELAKSLDIMDFERGAKISGSGFPVYKGKGAKLERALINFMLDYHIENHGFTEIIPPFIVNRNSMFGTGQLPKMEEDMYHAEKDDLYLIPTAEVPITNFHSNEILNNEQLPINYVGYSPCFRREAGSYGKDSKGFLRVHQFNKVEMVKFVEPETSYNELESLVQFAENILKLLQVPYRILLLCSGDLSFSAAKCYDIETWSPAENKYLEASSCSNFEDFQARRANIRFRNKNTKKVEFLHTLNGSGLATSRLMVSLLENNQTPEGRIIIPEVLRNYTGFEII